MILCLDKNIQALGMARTAEVKRDARIGEPAEQKQIIFFVRALKLKSKKPQ